MEIWTKELEKRNMKINGTETKVLVISNEKRKANIIINKENN